MEFKDLLEDEIIIKFNDTIRNFTTYHHMRSATNDEDLEFRRRSAKIHVRNKFFETTDASLNAGLWLYDKVCTKVRYQNGESDEPKDCTEDFKKSDKTARIKLQVINKYLSDIEQDDESIIKN